MKNIKIVIGSNFGDEGKGLITDYFANQYPNGIVVRFNGGVQASHTVITPNSIRHMFSHFGSGTLSGLPTHLSEFFIANPIIFKKEYEGLQKKNVEPKIYINYNCLVTTPYDMMINQIVENYRKNNKHGSCGLGINETIRRNDVVNIKFEDLYDIDMLFSKLLVIKNEYLQARLRELGVDSIPLRYVELLNNDNIILNYIKDIKFMLNKSAMCDINLLDNYNDIIFEGAQGLLLDQNSKYFPNVTPSNTGMKNVEHIINTLGYNKEDIEIIYVTRNYVTRHGIGKFETELEEKPYYNIIDLTNIPNEYQGILRFGLLDINSLKETIDNDLKYAKTLNYKKSLAITCLDQVDNEVKYIYNGENITSSIDEFINNIKSTTGIFTLYLSYGVTRDTIRTNISI